MSKKSTAKPKPKKSPKKPKRQPPRLDPKEWPGTVVELREVSSLRPYPQNTRVHSPEQIGQIVQSIQEFGWVAAVVVAEGIKGIPDGTIASGHARVVAAEQLGLKRVPVMVARGWTAEQFRAFSIADNKIPLNASWDTGALKIEVGELKVEGFELPIIGFSPTEIEGLLRVDAPPTEFSSVDENIPTEYECPKCGHRWSGSSKPQGGDDDDE